MDEITFDPLGTITVKFDGQEYKLGRPKMGQWRYFSRQLQALFEDNRDTLARLNAEVEAAEGKALVKAEAALREYSLTPFYEATIPWIREVFKQLGTPLPDSEDDWPAWLAADTQLPTQILAHWRTHPKASGGPSN